MNKEKFVCCFCGKTIESTNVDITALLVLSNWDKSEELQQNQQFFCHMKCLKDRLDKQIPLYIPYNS